MRNYMTTPSLSIVICLRFDATLSGHLSEKTILSTIRQGRL